ncbi:divalent-cation tolerance protein CutA [Terrihabitans sp. B22-R8]|uniref:divalent-cation tolerance protein CutA n=1 Tax=Terrihabitans sp. B22-R8 TaxID=3425128 RepID=UPI00403CF64A
MDDPVLVYTTWPDAAAAEEAGRRLVEARLCACANILPGMVSLYMWEGQLEKATEAVMILKTVEARIEPLFAAIRETHPYEIPAITAFAAKAVDPAFARWIADETAEGAS